MFGWILHIAAKVTTSSPDGSANVVLDSLVVVSSLLEGLALWCSFFGCVYWCFAVFPFAVVVFPFVVVVVVVAVVVIVAQLLGFVIVFL